MTYAIRPWEKRDYERVLEICVAAFGPIHQGFRRQLGPEIFTRRYHDWDWQYAVYLNGLLSDRGPDTLVHVAEDGGAVVGFVVTIMDPERKIGEIGLNAVDPAHQGRGIGKAMYAFALQTLKQRGAEAAYVGTGADAAHAPARAAYEAIGFDKSIPGIHYFKTL